MARILSSSAEVRVPLEGWSHITVPPGAHETPEPLPRDGWVPFSAPGLFAAGPDGRLAEADDHWLRHELAAPLDGYLLFEGLASHADIFINGTLVAQSRSMFLPVRVGVNSAAGSEICIRFHALDGALKAAPRRARWRPMMIEPNGLRYIRTTALGSMDGWCPEGRPTGPYRPIIAVNCTPGRLTTREIAACDLHASLDEGTGALVLGQLSLSLSLMPGITAQRGTLHCAGRSIALVRGPDGRLSATLDLPGIAPWFPATHGEPALHDACFDLDGTRFDLGKTGFRRITMDRGADGRGFGLIINGVSVFCRGAVWMTPDPARLPGAHADYAPLLTLAAEAGMNMLRVPGVGVYESDAFFALCDDLGILVFQDVMLANFDYPQADDAFCTALEEEVSHLLSRTQGSPGMAVLCGGSEVFQQAAMLGAPPEDWAGPVFDAMLPRLIAQHNAGLAYVPNSPSGGALPFVVEEGVAHYFGVGAYRRPLEDARRAQVRFAGECLAFANVPRDATRMETGIPRDAGADWDFADVRKHYTHLLFADAPQAHALAPHALAPHALAQATSAHVMEQTFTEWRRPASPTRGALVLALSNLAPGAGWGVIDERGQPKAAYYGLKRAFRPLHLGLTDEGVNGLHLHLVNERAEAFAGEVVLEALRDGRVPVAQGRMAVTLAPREGRTLSGFAVLGRFFDMTYAYRFGGREHDSVRAMLLDATGALVAEAFHFPQSAQITPETCGLGVSLTQDSLGYALEITTGRLARFVSIMDEAYRPEDDGFHLAPGTRRCIRLTPHRTHGAGTPHGTVSALNACEEVAYGA